MSNLRADLERQVLQKISKMPFDEVLAFLDGATVRSSRSIGGPKPGRRPRTTSADLDGLVATAVETLKKFPSGLKVRHLATEMGAADLIALNKALKQAMASGTIEKKGEKRATTYYAKEKSGGNGLIPAPPRGEVPIDRRKKKTRARG